MRAPTASARNEYAFILCAIGAAGLPDKANALAEIAARGLNWKRVLRRARLHGVASMLADSLQSLPPGSVPPFATEWLAQQRTITTTRSVFLTFQLARILSRFEADGIEALPFKGPTLAALAYGDVGLRMFSDLDILVRPAQVRMATAALEALGFRPQMALTSETAAAFLAAESALSFRRESDDCVVELHWRLTPRYLPFLRHPAWVWDMQAPVPTAGRPMRTMAPEWLLLFLCVHGAKHCWERLNWVADVARLIDGHVTLDWEGLLAESGESGSRRMLVIGILLAHELFGTALPPQIAARVKADVEAARLAHELGENLVSDAYRKKGAGARLSLHFRMRERFRDRVSYARHVALTPSVRDFESIRLPKYLSIMYLPMRPLRLVRELTGFGKRP